MMEENINKEEPIFLDLTKNMIMHSVGYAKNLKAIEIGFFIFERGWFEIEIIHISDTNRIELFANLDFFNGKFKRFHFNSGQDSYETGLINLKNFESMEEEELAAMVISYMKNTGIFSEDFVKFEITIPKEMFYYFKNNN